MSTVYTACLVIACSPETVLGFVQQPENQLAWSSFVRATRPLGGDRHEMTTMFGDTVAYRIESCPCGMCGTADVVMETPVGETRMPVRATPHSRGTFFSFGIVRPPSISDEDWARSCAGLEAELQQLKAVVEERAAAQAA
jgi:hypothetical protein